MVHRLDANDVVESLLIQWDAANPLAHRQYRRILLLERPLWFVPERTCPVKQA